MKKIAASESICSAENCLDICRLIVVTSKHTESLTCFYMTLLSYAAVNKQRRLMEVLISSGAGKTLLLIVMLGILNDNAIIISLQISQEMVKMSSRGHL